jgi:hypothetical protein
VISPLLANLFLHYAFDAWMARNFAHILFERYADDIICHCKSAEEARALWSAIADRLAVYKLVHRFIRLMQFDVPPALSRRGPGSTFAVGTGFRRCSGIGMSDGVRHSLMNRVNDSEH